MMQPFNHSEFISHFPATQNGQVYLDSAATALKPKVMAETIYDYYTHSTSNASRGTHQLASQIEKKLLSARKSVAKLLHITDPDSIIWTSGATNSVNLVAYAYGLRFFNAESEIIISELEHHSNLIPWIQIAKLTGAKIIKWEMEADGSLSLTRLKALLNSKTQLVAITQMSNITGYQPDIESITQLVHQHQALLLVDGAQGIVHQSIDIESSDVDFYLFSGHKYYGPTGVGVLYGKPHLLKSMSIWQGGGKMLKETSFFDFIENDLPYKFEAGTLNIAGILGLGASINFINRYSLNEMNEYVEKLALYLSEKMKQEEVATCINLSCPNSPIQSYYHPTIHAHDIALLLMKQNICIRDGRLCAHPALNKMGIESVFRVSLMPYNTREDIDAFVEALSFALSLFD